MAYSTILVSGENPRHNRLELMRSANRQPAKHLPGGKLFNLEDGCTTSSVSRGRKYTLLKYVDEVKHLGHILHYILDDDPDITRAVKDLNKKASSVLCIFQSAIKTFLIKLSLYGSQLWSLSSKSLSVLQIAINNILRKAWNLPYRSHSSYVHCTARVPAIPSLVQSRFVIFFSRNQLSLSPIVVSVFRQASLLAYTFLGYNNLYGTIRFYSSSDLLFHPTLGLLHCSMAPPLLLSKIFIISAV